MNAVRVRLAEDGSIPIPEEFLKKLDLRPKEEILLRSQPNGLIIQKVGESYLDEIGQLLKEGLRDVEWTEIEGARQDRCF